jgi:hypothetical protein
MVHRNKIVRCTKIIICAEQEPPGWRRSQSAANLGVQPGSMGVVENFPFLWQYLAVQRHFSAADPRVDTNYKANQS